MIDFFKKGKKCWENHNGQSIKGGRCLGKEESLSFERKKRCFEERFKGVLKKKKMRKWEDGGGIGNLRSDGCNFFFWAITLEIYKVQGACIIRSLPGACILKGIEGKYW